MKMPFEDWKKECKRLLYEADSEHTDENIHYVDEYHYEDYYKDGLTPDEANSQAYLDAELDGESL
jgi:hypothetical protein